MNTISKFWPDSMTESPWKASARNFISSLTDKQKQLAIITCIAVAIFTCICLAYHFFSKIKIGKLTKISAQASFSPQSVKPNQPPKTHPDPIKPPLDSLGKKNEYSKVLDALVTKIREKDQEIQTEKSTLEVFEATSGGVETQDIIITRTKIDSLSAEQMDSYDQFLSLFEQFIVGQYKQSLSQEPLPIQIIQMHILELGQFMDQQKGNEKFIGKSMKMIFSFMKEIFFTNSDNFCMGETQKKQVIVFCKLFAIVNEHLPTIKSESQLVNDLKIMFANLPLREARSTYPNLRLTKRNQRDLLLEDLVKQEERIVPLVLPHLKKEGLNYFSQKEIDSLARCLSSDKSWLKPETVATLRQPFEDRNAKPKNWNYKTIKNYFNQLNGAFNIFQSENPIKSYVESLRLISSAKKFFANQKGLPQIPFWYHATNPDSMDGILDDGEIMVRHQQAFKGSWVSNERERFFGPRVFGFNQNITKLDPNVFIGFEKDKPNLRWRGLQTNIPLDSDKEINPYLVFIGLEPDEDEIFGGTGGSFQRDRREIMAKIDQMVKRKKLKSHIKVYTNTFVDFIQQTTSRVLGNPGLSEKWWGKTDIEYLDQAIVLDA